MELGIIYDYFGTIMFDSIAVEEKPKTYKTIDGRLVPRAYRSVINKCMINKVYDDVILIYDCSKEEAIKIWNEHFDRLINAKKEYFEKEIECLEGLIIKEE
ncbi:hypothetical protein PMX22_10135 [Clostridium butyricum]|uniref:hypothetical protein n=1 Tax=Clostridium butyricum TaxID=1492 RepID=UPI00232B348A|nr:hypothetical protein [Clostridium butyricum]MDB2160160.1 hypothetical protein [Clostridium butyricum]